MRIGFVGLRNMGAADRMADEHRDRGHRFRK